MKRYEKRMAVLVLVLLAALSVKSVLLDPAKPGSGELALYGQYSLLAAPYYGRVGPGSSLYTYRIIHVAKTAEEGQTLIVVEDENSGERREEILSGRYEAKVRGYLFYILPVKQIRVEGGLSDHGIHIEN